MSNNSSAASPGFLVKPAVKKTNRKILMAIVALITVMVLVLMLTMTSGQNKAGEEAASVPPPVVESENKPLAPPRWKIWGWLFHRKYLQWTISLIKKKRKSK